MSEICQHVVSAHLESEVLGENFRIEYIKQPNCYVPTRIAARSVAIMNKHGETGDELQWGKEIEFLERGGDVVIVITIHSTKCCRAGCCAIETIRRGC